MSTSGTTPVNTTGETNVIHDVKKRTGSDCIPDKQMEEIARRLISFIDSVQVGDVVFAPEPPNNKKKLWVETDATGSNVGTIKRFDTKSGQWVDDHTIIPEIPDIPIPQIFEEAFTMASNDETIVMNHDFDTDQYFYGLVYTSNPTNDSKWNEVTKSNNSLTLRVRNANGVTLRVSIKENLIAPEE